MQRLTRTPTRKRLCREEEEAPVSLGVEGRGACNADLAGRGQEHNNQPGVWPPGDYIPMIATVLTRGIGIQHAGVRRVAVNLAGILRVHDAPLASAFVVAAFVATFNVSLFVSALAC